MILDTIVDLVPRLHVLRRAMSLLLETSLGDIVIDLEDEACPRTCENFLKLCKAYYYNLNAFFNGSFHRFTQPPIIHVA